MAFNAENEEQKFVIQCGRRPSEWIYMDGWRKTARTVEIFDLDKVKIKANRSKHEDWELREIERILVHE